ncbi:MAG TPA: DUF4180 domain-containing protein [Caulobacter sp.]|nr:DUF4180 domain-containing protein [Caulobacter sp.]
MAGQTLTLRDTVVFLVAGDGPLVVGDRETSDLVGEALGAGATMIAIPLPRLGPDFLRLSTRVAGELLQKLINYRFQVAILGDIAEAVAASDALRDFVRESNRGRMVWFLPDLAALEAKLAMNGR